MNAPPTTNTQFSIKSLLAITTIVAMLFAFLSAMGVSPTNALIGLGVLGTLAVSTAVAVEVAYRVVGMR